MADQLSHQGREIGSVLIAVQSETNSSRTPLLHADQILSDYIKTFHEFLYFKVTWLFDFSLDDFWHTFNQFVANPVGNHVAVVLYGHGAILDKMQCLCTKSGNLQIAILEERFARQCPKKGRYLFLDLCRERDTPAPLVYQTDTERGTLIVHSTLVFHVARTNLWSRLMAKHLRTHANLSDIIHSVDDEIIQEDPSIRQASDMQGKGTLGIPNYRELAKYENAGRQTQTRTLTKELGEAIRKAKNDMDAYRANSNHPDPLPMDTQLSSTTSQTMAGTTATSTTAKLGLPPEPILSFLDSPPDDRSNLTGPGLALSSAQGLATANLPPHLPPVASLSKQSNNPSKQPSAQGTQLSSTTSQTMAGTTATSTTGTTAPRTGMDEKIGCGSDIYGVPEYRKGLIGEMRMLGSVLGIGEDTKAILRRHGSLDDHLVEILDLYIEQKKTPTWKDFCKALKRFESFNKVRAKIEADHK